MVKRRNNTQGRNVMILVNDKPIALATSHTLNSTRAMNDASTKDDGVYGYSEPGNISWTASIDSLFSFDPADDDGQVAYDFFMDAQQSGTPVEVIFGIVSNPSETGLPEGGWKIGAGGRKGQAHVTDVQATGPNGSAATMSVSLQGIGKLEKVTA